MNGKMQHIKEQAELWKRYLTLKGKLFKLRMTAFVKRAEIFLLDKAIGFVRTVRSL